MPHLTSKQFLDIVNTPVGPYQSEKVARIKALRAATHLGLREAKAVIESAEETILGMPSADVCDEVGLTIGKRKAMDIMNDIFDCAEKLAKLYNELEGAE